MIVVVKIGTSSLTDDSGHIDREEIVRFCGLLAELRADGHQVVLVTSGAITAGRWLLGFETRPTDPVLLQAASAVGQGHLMAIYNEVLGAVGLLGGQLLLTPLDFFERNRYLRVRDTLQRLLSLGVLPVVNENDAVADDEIHFGDNDRIAALVAQLVRADLLVLLTDTEGVHTADPRISSEASLIAEIVQIDREMEALAGGVGNADARGGMTSKLVAAKIASWAGVPTVIASAHGRGCSATRWPARRWARWRGRDPALSRPASCGSPSPCARRARCTSTRGRVGPLRSAASRSSQWACGRRRGSSPPVTPSRLPDPGARYSPRGSCRWHRRDSTR